MAPSPEFDPFDSSHFSPDPTPDELPQFPNPKSVRDRCKGTLPSLPAITHDECTSSAAKYEFSWGEGFVETFTACNEDLPVRNLCHGGWISHTSVRILPHETHDEESGEVDRTNFVSSIWNLVGGRVRDEVIERHRFEDSPELFCCGMQPLQESEFGDLFEIGIHLLQPPTGYSMLPWDRVFFCYGTDGALNKVLGFGALQAENVHSIDDEVLRLLRGSESSSNGVSRHNFAADSEEARTLVANFLGASFVGRQLDLDLSARMIQGATGANTFLPIPKMLRTLQAKK